MTQLRQQMIRELELQRKAPCTVMSYVKAVEELARHYRRSPDQISRQEVRDFIHHALPSRVHLNFVLIVARLKDCH